MFKSWITGHVNSHLPDLWILEFPMVPSSHSLPRWFHSISILFACHLHADTPKFISLAWTSCLNSRVVYLTAYSTIFLKTPLLDISCKCIKLYLFQTWFLIFPPYKPDPPSCLLHLHHHPSSCSGQNPWSHSWLFHFSAYITCYT